MTARLGRRTAIALLILIACIVVGAAVSVTFGTADIRAGDVYRILFAGTRSSRAGNPLSPQETIVLRLRLPRIIMALATGAALSVTGAVLQAVFRNPMADPYVLGISSGAALGVTIGLLAGFIHPFMIQLSAFFGAMVTLMLVLGIAAATGGGRNSFSLLLSGIAVSLFLSAVISLLMYLNQDRAEDILFWTFGSLGTSSWTKVRVTVPALFLGVIVIAFQGNRLNVLTQGDETARSLGMLPGRNRFLLLILGSFVTATAVSVVGIIGFVGLLVPHAIRLIIGPDNRALVPVSALSGGLFLMVADAIGRTVLAPAELPVGIVTALLGAPYLLGLLFFRRRAFA